MDNYLNLTLINRLNAPTKRHRLAKWIKKKKTCIFDIYKRPTLDLKTYRLKVRGKNIL